MRKFMLKMSILMKQRHSVKHNIVAVAFMYLLTGCSLLTPNNEQYYIAHYYLWAKSLDSQPLAVELQKQLDSALNDETKIKLAVLYALPKAEHHNAYTAKTYLNQLNKTYFHGNDLAFVALLSEQLNQQIIALNRHVIATQQIKELEQQQLLTKEQVLKLTKQINQLKRIERDIQPQELN